MERVQPRQPPLQKRNVILAAAEILARTPELEKQADALLDLFRKCRTVVRESGDASKS